jgi:surface antigen
MAEGKAMSVTVENRRNRLRSAVAAILTILVLVPVGILFLQSWNTTRDRRDTTRSEQEGVEYLTRLGPLLTALVEAQGAALQGGSAASPALSAALNGVAEVDARLGNARPGVGLSTTDRWNGLRAKIEALPASAARGPAIAFQSHVEAADLLLALFAAVRDNSLLVRDPDNDLSHLQQAVAVDLPQAVNLSARTADLSLILANAEAGQQRLLAPQLGAAALTLDLSVDRLTDDLQAAAADTRSRTLSSNLLATVDGIRQGIEGLVQAATATKPDVAALIGARGAMQTATTGLYGTLLTEMDGLLNARLDDLDADDLRAMITAGAAALLVLLATVVPLLGRRNGRPTRHPTGTVDRPGGQGAAATFGDNPHDPVPYGTEVSATRRERSGVLR